MKCYHIASAFGFLEGLVLYERPGFTRFATGKPMVIVRTIFLQAGWSTNNNFRVLKYLWQLGNSYLTEAFLTRPVFNYTHEVLCDGYD